MSQGLKHISTPVMVSLLEAWIDPSRERGIIAAVPLGKAYLPRLDALYTELKETEAGAPASEASARFEALRRRQNEVDDRHDRKARGIYHYLGAAADLSDHPDEAQRLLELRSRLFPNALKVTGWSYADEIAEVRLVNTRLDPADHALLQSLPVPGGALAGALEQWLSAGHELGELEAQRMVVERELSEERALAGSRDATQARARWVQAAGMLVRILDLEGVEGAQRDRVTNPLEHAAEKAEALHGAGRQ
ncbi:MAG: hypothetical protein HY909_07435 [Deltaproteobacteria bacterium]|nr:hypothetical protein [Deltaproteobacteria bacterium]